MIVSIIFVFCSFEAGRQIENLQFEKAEILIIIIIDVFRILMLRAPGFLWGYFVINYNLHRGVDMWIDAYTMFYVRGDVDPRMKKFN